MLKLISFILPTYHKKVAANPRESKERKRFTEVENLAIRLGVERFAVKGEQIPWTEIKEYYSMELIDRTTTNLKDRWRTMNK